MNLKCKPTLLSVTLCERALMGTEENHAISTLMRNSWQFKNPHSCLYHKAVCGWMNHHILGRMQYLLEKQVLISQCRPRE